MHLRQSGDHTWELTIHYHRCPKCGWIIESRQDYEQGFDGIYRKELTCDRCQANFVQEKHLPPKFGPLLGKPTQAEVDWRDDDAADAR